MVLYIAMLRELLVQRNTGQGHEIEYQLTLTSYKYAKAVAGRRCRVHQRTWWHSCHAFAQLAPGSSCTGLRESAPQSLNRSGCSCWIPQLFLSVLEITAQCQSTCILCW